MTDALELVKVRGIRRCFQPVTQLPGGSMHLMS